MDLGRRRETFLAMWLLWALPVLGQSNSGELRLKVVDPAGLGLKTTVEVVSEANQYRNTLVTNEQGELVVQRLPYGIYRVEVQREGFAEVSETVEIRSSVAKQDTIHLQLPTMAQSVSVNERDTLIDPDEAGAVNEIGTDFIENRVSSLPGRQLQDLVNTQPGWLYEGNAVLHPRGSEYQTQFVIDGIPLTDNRSPGFGPAIGADDVQSMTIYTAGIPAEYGRKMGGVVELNTVQDAQEGLHGQVVLSGGSFATAGAFTDAQYTWGKNTLGASASGSMTDHYLNPVVAENYTNTGTTGDFSLRYQREFTEKDRLNLIVRQEVDRYDIPNELVQEAAGQRQNQNNIETIGIVSYQHVFSSNAVGDLGGMVRDNANNFFSNAESTPIYVSQHNWFREAYGRGAVTINHGKQEWKIGFESDNLWLNENFSYVITDPSQYDPSTPGTFHFAENRPDLEQAMYVQDLIRLGNWTINAGLRWDHYQLLVNKQAVQPRLAVSRYFPSADLIVHFSYDRVFQTPSFENILLSSSPEAAELNAVSLQLPVEPSEGNYYEVGASKALFKNIRLDVNYYRRDVNNYADDDQIQNTTISFPIAFQKAIIYGAEGKLEMPEWKNLSGYVSYSYMVGNAWYPVTGGLFLGDDAVLPTTGHFPDSQDQRNTVRGRLMYQWKPRVWFAGGIQYDSGLPFEFEGTYEQALEDYGPAVVSRINFARGRIYPSFQVNASLGVDVYRSERVNMQFQVDGTNLNNVLDVIDFGGLFSGNAIGPSRSFGVRLRTSF